MRFATLTLLLGAILAPSITAASPPRAAKVGGAPGGPRGTIDRSTAEQMVLDYCLGWLPKLPKSERSEEKRRLDAEPPRFGPNGIYHFNPPGGALTFEYVEEERILIARLAIHVYKSELEMPLDREEIAAALRAHRADKGIDTGGGRIEYSPKVSAAVLRRDWTEASRSARTFHREVNQLAKAAVSWGRKHYLDALQPLLRRKEPPAAATATTTGGFEAMVLLTRDLHRQITAWNRPYTWRRPRFVSDRTFAHDEPITATVHFAGALAGDDGNVDVHAVLDLVGPEGSSRAHQPFRVCWHPPTPEHVLIMGEGSVTVELEEDDPPGSYLLRLEVCDRVRDECVALEHPLQVLAR
jgi:hypothetical protein